MTAPDRDLQARLRFAHELLDRTDAVALEAFRGDRAARRKPDRSLVTLTDVAIETQIRDRLSSAYPRDVVLGEELGGAQDAAEGRWIVDPIDATNNFVRGIGVFATLLALERDGELALGLVSAPALGQRWYAIRGGGAYLREGGAERRIAVSAVDRWADAQLLFSSIGRLDPAREARLADLATDAWRNRGFGDFWAHVLVAQGSAEAMVETDLKPWDLAAPALVVAEAGGMVTDFGGRPSWQGPEAVSTNGLLHAEVLAGLTPG
ncbi:MAG: inositol monophosphatase family protein [Candidatus Limnocylindria bacterium]